MYEQHLYLTSSVEDDFKINILVPQPSADGKSTGKTEADGQCDVSTTERQQFTSDKLIGHGADKYAPEASVQTEDDCVANLAGPVKKEFREQRGKDDGKTSCTDAVASSI